MVTLSPRFAFLATLCALAALSSAPISNAAVLRLRSSAPALTNMASGHSHAEAAIWLPRHSSHVVEDPPVLPLPKSSGKSLKNYEDSGDSSGGSSNKNDRKIPSAGGSHGEKDVSAGEGDGDKGSPFNDDGAVPGEGGKVKDRRWNPFRSIRQLSELWFGDNNNELHSRAPHHHHHHHHHHNNRYRRRLGTVHHKPGHYRDLSTPEISADDGHVVHPLARHHQHDTHERAVVSEDHDHVRVGRSPHHHDHHDHYHHDHYNGPKKVVVSGDHDHVRFDRSTGEHPNFEGKLTISRDNDHLRFQRSVSIAGEQGHSYVVPRAAKRSAAQELLTLGKRANGLDGVPGHIDIISPSDISGGQRLASLVLAPSESTTSDDSTIPPPAFVLDASDMDGTEMYLLASSSNSLKSMLAPDEIPVTLQLPMFDATSASIAPYCATYDPAPPAPAPLITARCTEDPVGKSQSQLFAFDPTTGVVRPMWFDAQDSGSDGCIDDTHRAAPQNASLSNVTEVEGTQSDSTLSADRVSTSNFSVLTVDSSHMAPSDSSEGGTQGAQNVALVFVAADPEVMDTPADGSTRGSSVLATTTTAMESSAAGSLATGSPSAQAMSSSLSSVSASTVSSAGSNPSVVPSGTLASAPSSTSQVSGTVPTSSMVLGVQVVPESASNAVSTTSSSATPTMTPLNTQPYEWMFSPDS